MRIKNLDTKAKTVVATSWPVEFGMKVPEIRIGQFVFIDAYSCARMNDKILVQYERVIDLTPAVPHNTTKTLKRSSSVAYV